MKSKKKKKIDGRKCLIYNCYNLCDYRGHHIKSIGAGGTDDEFNIAPLCHNHHTLGKNAIHKIGIITFSEKFPEFKKYLLEMGWEECNVTKKFYHRGFQNK